MRTLQYLPSNCNISNKTVRNRSIFVKGQPIMFSKKPNSSWLPGRVVKIGDTSRSYIVEGEEGRYRRSETHISPRLDSSVVILFSNDVSRASSILNNAPVSLEAWVCIPLLPPCCNFLNTYYKNTLLTWKNFINHFKGSPFHKNHNKQSLSSYSKQIIINVCVCKKYLFVNIKIWKYYN